MIFYMQLGYKFRRRPPHLCRRHQQGRLPHLCRRHQQGLCHRRHTFHREVWQPRICRRRHYHNPLLCRHCRFILHNLQLMMMKPYHRHHRRHRRHHRRHRRHYKMIYVKSKINHTTVEPHTMECIISPTVKRRDGEQWCGRMEIDIMGIGL